MTEKFFNWVTTAPHPWKRAHVHGADQGQVGWKLHAIPCERGESLTDYKGRAALCGTRARHGWGRDLFIENECSRCLKAMEKQGGLDSWIELAEVLAKEREARLCPACGEDPQTPDNCSIPSSKCPRFGTDNKPLLYEEINI